MASNSTPLNQIETISSVPDESELDRFAAVANKAADAAGEVIRKCFRKPLDIIKKKRIQEACLSSGGDDSVDSFINSVAKGSTHNPVLQELQSSTAMGMRMGEIPRGYLFCYKFILLGVPGSYSADDKIELQLWPSYVEQGFGLDIIAIGYWPLLSYIATSWGGGWMEM
ncbi:hypothetical protein Vadar_019739 [Vaccinium darrowii]|uniref:Uncharacterized protein n=1 Tax=Vaccinium darrowii TaxID=229202 RepID=A0ACB7YEH8_9ERIC|nr:hypothetical protein Vadar_019739 [Vaccinium darrowii]